jgi:hypothetical protein
MNFFRYIPKEEHDLKNKSKKNTKHNNKHTKKYKNIKN